MTHDPTLTHGKATPFGNTDIRFGSVAKTFHWLTALLILTMIPLGIVAQYWPYDTSAQLAAKANLFSLHKTLGLLTFVVALMRIAWALSQPRPAMLPIKSKVQSFAAEAVHWALYGALVLVPLSGWIHHAASTGFAPIWWPFGQTLPFVPQSAQVADAFAGLHFVFNIVLVLSLVLHVAGAIKHHAIDRDATLKRMLPGECALPEKMQNGGNHLRPALAASVVWIGAVGVGLAYGTSGQSSAISTTLAAVPSEWVVDSGALSITVSQLGQEVTGQFAEWTAAINFSETPTDGSYGDVTVLISIPSLTLGGVTEQALAPDFLNATGFATAEYSGEILQDGEAFVVDGTLDMIGQSQPLHLPFTLVLDGDVATAAGQTELDRRSFGMGASYDDESTVGFGVAINFDLTATRGGDDG